MTLRLENVTKRVGAETHLYDIDLELRPGSLYVLFGLTLAGKTSLMRLMAGLDRPTSGRVLVDGRDVTGADVRRRDVAMVYQQFINYPSFTVYDNIASPLRRKGLPRAEVDRRVREAAATVHIDGLLDRLPAELSGGQQQRTALARALVKEAPLLLLDEPLVNLDYKLREELRAELRAIFGRRAAIVVYATTEPLEALMLGGHTVVLDRGRVLQTGPTLEVYHRPASVRITQVFSEPPMNLIDGAIEEGGTFRLGRAIRGPLTANLQGVPPGRYRFGVRANHVFVRRDRPDDIEVGATVELAEVSGSETFVHVRHDDDAAWTVQPIPGDPRRLVDRHAVAPVADRRQTDPLARVALHARQRPQLRRRHPDLFAKPGPEKHVSLISESRIRSGGANRRYAHDRTTVGAQGHDRRGPARRAARHHRRAGGTAVAKTFSLSITGAEGARYTGRCTLPTAAGEETLDLSGVVPLHERIEGEGLACRIEADGPITVEVAHGGGRSRSATSGGVVNISVR